MLKDNFFIAFRSLSQRKLRSWLTMIGIFIGIAAVVSLIGLGEGLRGAIIGQFGFLGTDVLSIQASGIAFAGPPGSGVVNPLDVKLIDKLKKVNGVKAAFGRILETNKLEYDDQQHIGFTASIPLGSDRSTFERILNLETEKGRMLRDSDNNKVILGYGFSKDKEIFEKGVNVGDKVLINDKEFEVVGILENKGSFIFDSTVLMNVDEVLNLFGDDNSVDIIAIQVNDENEIPQVRETIEKLLRKERNVKLGEEDFTVDTPQNAISSLNDTLFAVQLFVYIVSAISLVVGGIGIMNTMYTSVLERKKEIGIMKAIGARNSTIFTLFFIESGFLGMVGGVIGISLGLILAYGLAFIGKVALGSDLIQADVSLWLIFGSLSFSFILGTLFGVLPAIQAAKLQPVDALRSK
jgi:putative ABC transport system permease protein